MLLAVAVVDDRIDQPRQQAQAHFRQVGADGVLQVDGRRFREKRLMASAIDEAIGNGFLKSLRDQHVAVVAQRAFFTCAMLVFHCGQAVGDVCVAVNARDFFD